MALPPTPPGAIPSGWEGLVSWDPCTICRSTGNGRLFFAYVSTFQGQTRIATRLRLCASCFDSALTMLLESGETQDPSGRWWSQEQRADLTPFDVASLPAAPSTRPLPSTVSAPARKTKPVT